MRTKLTFHEWMKEVERIMQTRFSVHSDDLPDFCYADLYDEGVSPLGACRKAIRNAKDS